MSTKLQKQVQAAEEASFLRNLQANQTRARSVTVGTCFGGTAELSMRLENGVSVWCPMQPVEIIELIHQLAANVGCHISLKPRDDFSSWREWRVSEAEKKHLNGHPPFVNDMAPFQKLGSHGFNQQEAEATMEHELAQQEYEYVNGAAQKKDLQNEALATKKLKNRRSTKRASAAA